MDDKKDGKPCTAAEEASDEKLAGLLMGRLEKRPPPSKSSKKAGKSAKAPQERS